MGLGLEYNGTLANVVDQIALTNANAIRLLPNISQLQPSDVQPIIARAISHGLVTYISPGDRTWFGQAAVHTMLTPYLPYLVIDAYQEAEFDDPVRWLSEAQAAVVQVRGYGYSVPLVVISNQYGRDLPTLLAHGADVEAADPIHNTILGWQAYWGSNASNPWTYQQQYNLTWEQAVAQAAAAPFTVQLGLDYVTDFPDWFMDYGHVMDLTKPVGLGWLWWDYYLPFGDTTNDLTSDNSFAHLSTLGQSVVVTQPSGFSSPNPKACKPPGF